MSLRTLASRHTPVDRPSVWPMLLVGSGWLATAGSILWSRDAPPALTAAVAWASLIAAALAVSTLTLVRGWPRLIILVLVVLGDAALVAAIVASIVDGAPTWTASTWVTIAAVVVPPVVLAIVGGVVRHQDVAFDVVGVLPLIAVVASLAWTVNIAAFPPSGDALAFQVLCVLVGALLAIALVAVDWSRTGLHVVLALLGAVLLALAVRVGEQQRITEVVSEPAASLRGEYERLQTTNDQAVAKANGADRQTLVTSATAAQAELQAASRGVLDDAYRTLLTRTWETLDAALDAQSAESAESAEGEGSPATVVSAAQRHLDEAQGLLDALAVQPVPSASAAPAGAARAAAQASGRAVAAVVRFEEATPVPVVDVETAWTRFCGAERTSRLVVVKECATFPPTNDDVVDALHAFEVAVAEYRSAVAPSEQNTALLAAARADRGAIDIGLRDAVVEAPEAVFDALAPGPNLRLVPGLYGWIVLLLAALMFGRRMFKVNARQGPGPVSFPAAAATDPTYVEAFRVAVLANVASPRAEAVTQVAETLKGLSTVGAPAKGIVDAINGAVTFILSGNRGFEASCVAVSLEEGSDKPASDAGAAASTHPAGTAPRWRVLIRIVDAQTRAVIAVKDFEGTDRHVEAQRGGQWAAGKILAQSSRIPAWARWTELNSVALEPMRRGHELAHTTAAIKLAPTNGMVLVNHAYALLHAGRLLDAVVVAARAATVHPRHLQARNLLALALVVLADSDEWKRASAGQVRMVEAALGDTADVLGLDYYARAGEADAPSLAVEPADREVNFAHELWSSVIIDVQWVRRAAGAMRRPDRDSSWITWRLGRPHSPTLTGAIAESAKLADIDPGVVPDGLSVDEQRTRRRRLERAERRTRAFAERHHDTHFVAFNLACAYARRDQAAEAMTWLQRTLLYDTATVASFSRARIEADADLNSLEALPQFRAFLDHLDSGGHV